MSYRLTKKAAQQRQRLIAMRAGRERARLAAPAPDYPQQLPDLRRRIVVEDWDFGHKVHVLELHRTNRRDCYRVFADGVEWKRRIGWSNILAGLRKSMTRVGSI